MPRLTVVKVADVTIGSRASIWCALLVAGVTSLVASGCSSNSEPGSGFVTPPSSVTIIPELERESPVAELRGPSVRDYPSELVLEVAEGPAVINVWASWCGPCRGEAADLEAAARALPDVAFIGINGRERSVQNGQAFQRTQKVSFDSISDPDGSILLTANLFPTSYFPPRPSSTPEAASPRASTAHSTKRPWWASLKKLAEAPLSRPAGGGSRLRHGLAVLAGSSVAGGVLLPLIFWIREGFSTVWPWLLLSALVLLAVGIVAGLVGALAVQLAPRNYLLVIALAGLPVFAVAAGTIAASPRLLHPLPVGVTIGAGAAVAACWDLRRERLLRAHS